MAEEGTITQTEVNRLKAVEKKHQELTKQLEEAENVKIKGTVDPAQPADSYCGNCNDNGTQTIVKKGQTHCEVCGDELDW